MNRTRLPYKYENLFLKVSAVCFLLIALIIVLLSVHALIGEYVLDGQSDAVVRLYDGLYLEIMNW